MEKRENSIRPPKPLYKMIASTVDAYHRCKTNNSIWETKHEERLRLFDDLLPSGSGIDNGTQIDIERSTGEKIVLITSFHHMNSGGYYDGWTEHTVVIKPSLIHGIDLLITGKDRNEIKEYLYQTYWHALTRLYDVETLKEIPEEQVESNTPTLLEAAKAAHDTMAMASRDMTHLRGFKMLAAAIEKEES